MSSLVSSASPWINDNDTIQKRPSTLRKTTKMRNPTDGEFEKKELQELQPETIHDVQHSNQERNDRVAELLNKITSADNSSSSSRMSDFTPPPKPELVVKKDMPIVGGNTVVPGNVITPTNTPYSNYTNVYKHKPYYTAATTNIQSSDKVIEKLNYMIHLLEQQQHEETHFVTEECVLYALLGIFVIYIVDSFARSGKYTR